MTWTHVKAPFKLGVRAMSDQARDTSGRELYRLIQIYPPPPFVKDASAAELCGSTDLPAHVYADPRHRLYPCHTPAATWTSHCFFLEKKSDYRPDDARAIADRLTYYGKYHNILAAMGETEKQAAQHRRQQPIESLPDDDFAFVFQDSGVAERHCPLRNGNEVVKAAEYLLRWRDSFPYELRRDAAERIMHKAASLGVSFADHSLEDFLEKQAGYGVCTAKDLATLLVDRVQASRAGPGPLSQVQGELLKMAKLCVEKPSQVREPGTLAKVASIVDQFDRQYGLYHHYGPDFPRIEDVLFGITREKMASVANTHCATITGSLYNLADLERLKMRDVSDAMGSALASALSSDGVHLDSEKMAAVIPTLPRGDAELFDRLMDDLGIMPIAREKAAHAVRMSRDYLQEMADGYRQTLSRPGGQIPQDGSLLAHFAKN
jgi:hypothetical protein